MSKWNLLIILSVLLFSCRNNQDVSKLDETIYVRSQGSDMPVHIHGNLNSKVLLLMVHGGPGGSGLDYRAGKYTVPLEQRFAVAYWDQRGQGMSHGKYNTEAMTLDQMCKDLDAVIQVLQAKYGDSIKTVVLGHSWGGMLTANYMINENNQKKISGWIEANGAHDIPQLNKDAIQMFKEVADEQINEGNNVSNWKDVLTWAQAIDTNNITADISYEINLKAYQAEEWLIDDGVMAYPEPGGNKVPFLAGPVNPLVSFLSGNLTNSLLLDEIERTALTKELHKVTVPTLILWGKYDFVVPPSLGWDTYHSISSTDKEIVLFEQSGHSPMSNEWEAFSEAIISFIEKLE
ncbi:MAG: hypothetical protein CMP61_03245 [Flavobacteriales bacterium]|nr:hypothetical protein [Flavobacteriales bacterium]